MKKNIFYYIGGVFLVFISSFTFTVSFSVGREGGGWRPWFAIFLVSILLNFFYYLLLALKKKIHRVSIVLYIPIAITLFIVFTFSFISPPWLKEVRINMGPSPFSNGSTITGGCRFAIWEKEFWSKSAREKSCKDKINQMQIPPSWIDRNGSITNDKTVNWNHYNNSKYGYSIKYPDSWFNLPNYGAPDTDKYFSNINAENPLEMGPDGFWITIRISENNNGLSLPAWASKTPGNPQFKISDVKNIVINGIPAIQQTEDFTKAEGTEGGYGLATYLMKGNMVYSIKSISFNSTTSKKHEDEYALMAESFILTN